MYDRVFPLADELFVLDGEVARIAAKVRRSGYEAPGLAALAGKFEHAEKLWQ